jgi:hypothetical protein
MKKHLNHLKLDVFMFDDQSDNWILLQLGSVLERLNYSGDWWESSELIPSRGPS